MLSDGYTEISTALTDGTCRGGVGVVQPAGRHAAEGQVDRLSALQADRHGAIVYALHRASGAVGNARILVGDREFTLSPVEKSRFTSS